jgi:tRNA(fMet)-specific endonuclease VapC
VIYFPDTNAFSFHLRGRDPTLSARMARAVEDGELRLSLVVLFELRYGAEKALLKREKRPADRVAKLQRIVPVELLPEAAALHYGRLRSHLEKSGCLIGAMDMLLAAHALAMNAVVVTGNTREFKRVPNLKVENWHGDAPRAA